MIKSTKKLLEINEKAQISIEIPIKTFFIEDEKFSFLMGLALQDYKLYMQKGKNTIPTSNINNIYWWHLQNPNAKWIAVLDETSNVTLIFGGDRK